MKSLPILGIVAKLKEKQKLCFVKESLGGKKKYCDLRQAGLNFCNAAHKAKKSRERERYHCIPNSRVMIMMEVVGGWVD